MAISCGRYMFKYFRNCRTVFQSVYTILHSHQQCMTVPVTPHPHQHLLYDFSHTIECAVVFHCRFNLLFPNGESHWAFFMCLLAIHLYIFLGEMSVHIYYFLCYCVFRVIDIYWIYKSAVRQIFSICDLPFHLLNTVFLKVLILMKSDLLVSFFFYSSCILYWI